MTLRKTTITAACLAFFVLFTVLYELSNTVIMYKFSKVETEHVKDHLDRAGMAVQGYIDRLSTFNADWAWWDDTYEFVREPNAKYVESNLPQDTFETQQLNVIAFYGADAGLVWAGYYDLAAQNFAPLPEGWEGLLVERPELWDSGGGTVFKGILNMPDGAYVASCNEILTSAVTGPPRGFLIMARRLDDGLVDMLAERTHIELSITPIDDSGGDIATLKHPDVAQSKDTVTASASLIDLAGRPSHLLSISMPRDIHRVGKEAARLNLGIIAGATLLLGTLVVLFLERRILTRVSSLSNQVRGVGAGRGPASVRLEGRDELAGLASDIRGLLTALRENEDFLEKIMSTLQVGVVLVDTETRRITEVNPFAAEMIGQSREEIVGTLCNELFCPGGTDLCPALDTDECRHSCSRTLQKPNGETVEIMKSVDKIFRNNTEQLLETFVDVTELERAKSLIQASEEKYRTIFMNTGTASILVDEAGLIRLANSEFLKLAGVTRSQVDKGLEWSSFCHPDDLHRLRGYNRTRRTDPDKAPRDYRARFVDAKGDVKIVNLTVAAIPSTRLSVASIEDVTDSVEAEKQLAHKAFYDSLTGLPNRQLFNDRLQQAIDSAERNERKIGVMLLDLDEFKNVNDSLGHPVGDEVLKQAAGRLTGILRKSDTLARLGGDEFTMIVEDMDNPSSAATVAENLLKQFREPFKIEDTDIFLGASIGIAVYPIDGATTEELVRNADLAMYKSKESGKNTYSHYTTGLNAEARQKLRLESDLRRALAEEELEVFFQPTVSLDSGEIFGAEALVRWRGEDGEYRNTAEFIHFAESTGIIVEIDLFVMETACRAAAQWIEKLSDPLRISVNVSTRHFKRGDLREKVAAILEKTGLPAERLNLEITETALMQNLQQASSALIELNALGVSFSLDDYGTGYSSLYYLNTLPVQSLKIDKRFVSRLTEQAGDGPVLVKTVMSLAENLGLAAVAEGVETRGQLEALRELGCRQGQGFLFSPAVPPERFERLLAKGRLTPARDNISHIDGKTAGLFKVK